MTSKRWFAAALCLMIALASLPALGESGNTTLFVRDDQNPEAESIYINSVAVVGDAVYMLGSGLYRYRPGDEKPETLMTSDQVWGGGYIVSEEPMEADEITGTEGEGAVVEGEGTVIEDDAAEGAATEATDAPPETEAVEAETEPATPEASEETVVETTEEPAVPSYSPQLLVQGGDVLHALDTQNGRLGVWDEALKNFNWDIALPWEGMVREREENWKENREVVLPTLIDGALYLLAARDFDMWGEYVLQRYDLAAGTVTTLPTANLQTFIPYKPGKLVGLARNQENWASSVVVIDIATGATDSTLFADESGSLSPCGFAYNADTDTLYASLNSAIMSLGSEGLGEPFAYYPGQANSNCEAGLLSSGHYVINTHNGVCLRNIDPQYKPAGVLHLTGSYMDDVATRFLNANPDVAIEMSGDYLWGGQQVIDSMVSQESKIDLFEVSSFSGLKGLRDKGYLADISSSAKLMAAVEAMYPQIKDVLIIDGKLYGFPQYLSLSFWNVDVASMERLGLGGMPETMIDFMDLIERWEEEELAEENPSWTLLDPWYNKQSLLYELVMRYVTNYETPDQPLNFNTPELRATLERWEALPDFGSDPEDENNVISYDGSAATLISTSASPFTSYFYSDVEGYKPELVLAPMFAKGEAPVLDGNLQVYVVNPNSSQQDLAIRYLEYLAENMEKANLYMLRPDLNEPVPDPYWVKEKANAEKDLAEAEAQLAKAEEADVQGYTDQVQWRKDWLKSTEEHYWLINAEDIALYRKYASGMSLNTETQMLDYSSTSFEEFWKELGRYAEGQIKLDELLRELDKKAKMIFYEGQ